jgi:hypothetical protein
MLQLEMLPKNIHRWKNAIYISPPREQQMNIANSVKSSLEIHSIISAH